MTGGTQGIHMDNLTISRHESWPMVPIGSSESTKVRFGSRTAAPLSYVTASDDQRAGVGVFTQSGFVAAKLVGGSIWD